MISDMGTITNVITTAMADYLEESGLATEDEIILVCDIIGWNQDTMCSILYERSGYRFFGQLEDWSGYLETWLDNQ